MDYAVTVTLKGRSYGALILRNKPAARFGGKGSPR